MVSAGVLAAGACKKKAKEDKAPDPATKPTTGTAGMTGTGAGTAAEPPKEAKLEGKALADRYMECTGYLNDNKLDEYKTKCLAADFKGHEADGPTTEGADAAIEMFKGYMTAFPDMKGHPQLVMVNGRNILGVIHITGTHTGTMKGPMGEIPATNKKIGMLMFHRLKINDENKAEEEWTFFDPGTMMGQLGLMPKGAPPMRAAMEKGWEGAPIIVVAADNEVEKNNLDAVKKGNEAFQTGKPADYMAFYADDAMESDQAGSKDAKGKKEIQAGAEMFKKAFPDLKLDMTDTFAAGDYVVQMGTFTGTNKGALGPMKPTNKEVKGQFAEVIKMKDGKMAEVWRFRNGMSMAMQLGLAPPMGGDAPKGDAPKGGEMKKDEKAPAKKG
jgi:predicted ester cyclase